MPSSRTTHNLLRTREAVLNLASAELVDHVDRLALLTGTPQLSPHKRETGYRYEPRKFEAAGLAPEPSDLVAPHRVAECPIQLECRVLGALPHRERLGPLQRRSTSRWSALTSLTPCACQAPTTSTRRHGTP